MIVGMIWTTSKHSSGCYCSALVSIRQPVLFLRSRLPFVQMPYMLPPRRPWKRCASHVYIAHFIEYQQTMIQLSSASLFLQQRQQPTFTPPPPSFGGRPEAAGPSSGGSNLPSSLTGPPPETGPGPAPSALVKSERGPVETKEGGGPQQVVKERPSAFQDAGARKAPQQPDGLRMQVRPVNAGRVF